MEKKNAAVQHQDILGRNININDWVAAPIRTWGGGSANLSICKIIGITPKMVRVTSKRSLDYLVYPHNVVLLPTDEVAFHILKNSD